MPIDYSKAKIYKLTTIHDPNLVYYGSTVNPLYKRKQVHKSFFKSGKLSLTSFKLFELGVDDVEITLVENINCNSKEELHQRERFYIENNNCINKNLPSRGKKEYREVNKDINNAKYKEYYNQNKDIVNTKNKEYREQNKDKLKIKQKEHRAQNKDVIKIKQKEYYERNKDVIKIKQKEYRERKKSL